MKKLFFLLFIVSLIIACSKRTVAAKDVAVNTSTEISSSENSKSNSEATEASVLAAGKTIYETKCIRCHGMKPTASYTPDRWDGILKLMVPKAGLTEIETEQVTAYVKANAKM
jgi:cytochrome c5